MELEDQSEAILSVAVRERNVLLMPDTFARNELLSVLETGAEETSQVMKALEERRSGPLSMTSLAWGTHFQNFRKICKNLMGGHGKLFQRVGRGTTGSDDVSVGHWCQGGVGLSQ
eukprot:symbB.v1.2.016752.t1/scaffold1279.1/size127165/1